MIATVVALLAASRPILHSHNDYLRERPLHQALDHGFRSVEADVFLIDGELRVAHERENTRPGRTLESLYLEPLRTRAQEPGLDLILLVDIKAEGEAVYRELRARLPQYPYLTRWESGRRKAGKVMVILSGDRPIETVRAEANRWVALDGRLPDLDGELDPELFPLVSDSWSRLGWTSGSPAAGEALDRLRSAVGKARAKGVLLRFWGVPDRPALWGQLRDEGVPVIGTDQIESLARFLG